MYKNVLINLDNISLSVIEEIKKNNFDDFKIEDIIKSFRININGNIKTGKIEESLALEYFITKKYLLDKGYLEDQIKLFINKPIFIYNDEFYFIENSSIHKIDVSKLLFFSMRGTNWNYPVFHILQILLEKKGGKLVKTNLLNYNIPFKGKLYALKNLYKKRKKLIGDIIIPYKIGKENYDLFIDFIKLKFGNEIIVKKDNTQTGAGVYPCDLNTEEGIKKFKKVMLTHKEYLKEVYILPYYNLKEEYRFYFTKFNGKIKIYSMKIKTIKTLRDEILKQDSFLYWKNVILKWEYIKNNEWQKKAGFYYKEYLKAREYLKLLEYNTGSLEFAKTHYDKYIFFEVNSMSDPVCFEGEDVKNIKKYYIDILDNLIK